MALYRYEAVAGSGELLVGEMEAEDQATVVQRLQALGHVPIRAEHAQGSRLSWFFSRPLNLWGAHSSGDLVLLTRQLGTLLHAGLPLDHTLELAQGMVAGRTAQAALGGLLDAVRGGHSLANAMALQQEVFPPFYVSMVRAGEAGGTLDTTLQDLADYLEGAQAAREQVVSALIYPLIVLTTGCLSMAVLFAFVIPQFAPLLEQPGTTAPVVVRLLLAASEGFQRYWWTGPVAAATLWLAWRQSMRRPEARRRHDRRKLTTPVVGAFFARIEVARFSRVLGTLLRSGVALLSALSITRDTLTNMALRDVIGDVIEQVKQGKSLAEPLSRSPLVPAIAVQLTRAGEESARLDEMLLKLAEIYDRETRRDMDRLLALLVPSVTIGLGLLVALVVGAILSAIFSVYDLA